MTLDVDRLATAVGATGADAYLIVADGHDPNQRYLSGFDAPDRFGTLFVDRELQLLVRSLERGRAETDSNATTVHIPADFEYRSLLETHGQPTADHHLHAAFLQEYGVEHVLVPPTFPFGLGDGLRDLGIDIVADGEGIIESFRAVKSSEEIEMISRVQSATERAMQAAIDTLQSATEGDDGYLHLGGDRLTSERVRSVIDRHLLEAGCHAEETIVAGGKQGADPHHRGSGPLAVDRPIVIDIFPQEKASRYHADMTRTVLVGTPPDPVARMFEVVAAAHDAALEAVEPGVDTTTVHAAACAVVEDAGYPTLRTDERADRGFIHGTGHGIGLAVHERPSVNDSSDEVLEPGHVITIEPGIYDPELGGVRLEDLVVVTDDGMRNLTDFPMQLTV